MFYTGDFVLRYDVQFSQMKWLFLRLRNLSSAIYFYGVIAKSGLMAYGLMAYGLMALWP